MAGSESSEDSDSSPSASSSSSSDMKLAVAGTVQPTDPNPDPESPVAAHQSSDESGSSDGVLVELPSNNDQVEVSFSFLFEVEGRKLPLSSDSG